MVRQRRRNHQLRLPGYRRYADSRDSADRCLHLRACRSQRGLRKHRTESHRGSRPEGHDHRGSGSRRLRSRVRRRAAYVAKTFTTKRAVVAPRRSNSSFRRKWTKSRMEKSPSSVPTLKDLGPGKRTPLAIFVEVAGRQMQQDFEPILERQIHHLINFAQGMMHIGQRDIAWVRIAKGAVEKGLSLSHIGSILHAKLHQGLRYHSGQGASDGLHRGRGSDQDSQTGSRQIQRT